VLLTTAKDGFFAALIAGPEAVMHSEYNRELFGGEPPEFSSLDEAKYQHLLTERCVNSSV
jgi:hypothetical protein